MGVFIFPEEEDPAGQDVSVQIREQPSHWRWRGNRSMCAQPVKEVGIGKKALIDGHREIYIKI
jgi:hypothetical protein